VRVLLDECLPRRLKRELVGHDARTVPEMGWASKRNGELLTLAATEFDAFLTADRNLSHQHDVSAFDIAVVVLVARSNSINDLRPLAPQILEALANAEHGHVMLVGGD
jgi:predicted nuclease of predicted toxin-antitoxin system